MDTRCHPRPVLVMLSPALACIAGLLCTVLAVLAPPRVAAADDEPSLDVTAGYEHYVGPDHQLTRTVAAEVEGKLRGWSASLSGGRFHDEGAGVGVDLEGKLGVPVAPRTHLTLGAEAALGDSSYRLWTLKAGPAFALPRKVTLTALYLHLEDNDGVIADGASAELEVPIVPDRLSSSGTLSYTTVRDVGVSGIEGSVGLSWTPVEHLELEGDVGYTQTGIGINTLFSTRHLVTQGRQKGRGVGRGGGTTTVTTTSSVPETPGTTAQLAVRVSWP